MEQLETLGTSTITHNFDLQQRREEMLRGEFSSDCEPCWALERAGLVSLRTTTKADHELPAAVRALTDQDVLAETQMFHHAVAPTAPVEIEFRLTPKCNLKCAYCGSLLSSAWKTEEERFGDPPNAALEALNARAVETELVERFAETFWWWFRDNCRTLQRIGFSGGEPTLLPELYETLNRVREILRAKPPDTPPTIVVITNLSTAPRHLQRLLADIRANPDFRYEIAFSNEAYGARGAYIRSGMRWSRFAENLDTLLEFTSETGLAAPVGMLTINCLCVGGLEEYFRWIQRRETTLGVEPGSLVSFIVNTVAFPEELSVDVLPPELGQIVDSCIAWLREEGAASNRQPAGFAHAPDEVLTSISERIRSDVPRRSELRRRLRARIERDDDRRGTSFRDVFPEHSWLFEV